MIQRRFVALLLTIVIAIPTFSGVAQTHPLEAELTGEHPGVQASVWRTYTHPDAESTMTAEDTATLSPVTIDITVTSFDTPENAAAYFDVLADLPFEFDFDQSQGLVSRNQNNQTNDTQTTYRLRLGEGNERTHGYEQMLLQEDELVFTLLVEWRAVYQDGMDAPDNLAVPDAIEPLAEQIAASEPSPDPERFAEDGSSTGGLWGYMPADDDPLLMGLVAMEDIAIFPPPSETAAAGTTTAEDLPGIQQAMMREYTQASGEPSLPELRSIGVMVYQFDTPENAATAYDLLVSNITYEVEARQADPGTTVVIGDASGVGERAHTARVNSVTADGYQVEEYLATLDESYVFVVKTVTRGPQTTTGTPVAITLSSAAAINLAMSLVANGEPSADDAVFAEDGTSTGGDWGFMPETGDPLLQGLTSTMDQQLYPTEGSGS